MRLKDLRDFGLQNFIFYTVFLGLLIFGVLYLFSLTNKVLTKVNEEKAKLASLKNELSQLEDFKNKKESASKIEKVFVKKDAPVEFINFLEEGAKKFKLDLQISILEDFGKKENSYYVLTFALTLKGQFPNLAAFIEYIELSPFLVQIESAIFKAPESKIENLVELPTLNLNIITYAK